MAGRAELAAGHEHHIGKFRQCLDLARDRADRPRCTRCPGGRAPRAGRCSLNRATPTTRLPGAARLASRASEGPILPPTPRMMRSPGSASSSACKLARRRGHHLLKVSPRRAGDPAVRRRRRSSGVPDRSAFQRSEISNCLDTMNLLMAMQAALPCPPMHGEDIAASGAEQAIRRERVRRGRTGWPAAQGRPLPSHAARCSPAGRTRRPSTRPSWDNSCFDRSFAAKPAAQSCSYRIACIRSSRRLRARPASRFFAHRRWTKLRIATERDPDLKAAGRSAE